MTDGTPSLEALRRQIDAIDDELRGALARRMALIEQVTRAKRLSDSPDGSAMRPAREAQILHRVTSELPAPVPPFLLARVWAEIINTATAQQGPHAVAVCAPERSVGYWDLARNHFGSATPMTLHRSPVLVLRAVNENPGIVGVLPPAYEGEAEPWWPELARQYGNRQAPKVQWRLPFISSPAGRFENLAAYVIARVPPEPSGRDVSLAVVTSGLDLSRGRLMELCEASGLSARLLATHEERSDDQRLHLVEIDGFHVGEAAFDGVRSIAGDSLRQIASIGVYPQPVPPPAERP